MLTTALLLALTTVSLVWLAYDARQYAAAQRGRESGLAATLAPLEQPRLGTNVSLELYPDEQALRSLLHQLRQAGLGVLRQRFAWDELEPAPGVYDWTPWDQVLPLVHAEGFDIIAVLDTSPVWARAQWEADNRWAPPLDIDAYARFASAFATRYGRYIQAYQVWDQPNIAPHWGAGEVDPAGYVRMLAAVSTALRTAQPQARIIAGGLAPNTESGGRNQNDLQYLREICRRGALQYCDILGVKGYGFWSGAYDRRASADLLNFSRIALARAELVRRGAQSVPIWLLEGGWCALPVDWTGLDSPLGNDSAFVQSQRLEQAIERLQREWPWLSLACLQVAQPNAPAEDPAWGFALLDAQGHPTALYDSLRQQAQKVDCLTPGLTLDWRPYALPNQSGVRFWGTDVQLLLEGGVAEGDIVARVVGAYGERVIALPAARDAPGQPRNARIASRLAPGLHTLEIEGTPEQLSAVIGLRVGYRAPARGLLSLAGGGLALLGALWATRQAARRIPWGAAWQRVSARYLRLRPIWQVVPVIAAFAAVLLCPWPAARLALLALYAVGALLRPDVALLVAIACIPFAPLTLSLARFSFAPIEIATLIAAAARLGNALLQPPVPTHPRPGETPAFRRCLRGLYAWTLADWTVLALTLFSLASCFLAEYQRVAFREWRTVILEPALLFALIRAHRPPRSLATPRDPGTDTGTLLWLVDVLYLGGLVVALYALGIYGTPGGVIEAEGVLRARAFYGSPNNLALYLERLLPLGLALAAGGRTRWRRWAYGLGAVPILAALVLTFSRGAWLLGLPAGLLATAWLRGRRWRTLALALLVLSLVVLIPLARSPRFAGLLDPTSGTTFLRLSLWQAAWDMLRDHPIRGVGLDNFLYYYTDYIRLGAEVDRYLSHPHNVVLDFWLRLGIGGLVLLGALLAALVQSARRAWNNTSDRDIQAMAMGLAAGVVAALAHGLIDASFFVTELAYVWLFTLAWVTSTAPSTRAPEH